MLALPDEPTNTLKLADWVELRAVRAGDGNSSAGDLDSALKSAAVFDRDHRAARELAITQVFEELRARSVAAGDGYPFKLSGTKLQSKESDRSWSYLFCLCLSYISIEAGRGAGKIFPTRVFEELCTEVARKFVGGEAIRFGWPRLGQILPTRFTKALDALCQLHIREGHGFSADAIAQVQGVKDDGLDIVAWRDHPDRLPGKLMFLGACAAGHDWPEKLGELQPKEFCEQWMTRTPAVLPLKGFFVPHRIRPERWEKVSRRAGIVFDRCRIAAMVPRLPASTAHGDALRWLNARIASPRA